MLDNIDLKGKNVLEVGCGPGGNLNEILKYHPATLTGADISATMVGIAKENVDKKVEIVKTDGKTLPFENDSFDIVITVTVLQHNTDENMMSNLISEMCRVSKNQVVIFERIESEVIGDDLCKGRPIEYYNKFFKEGGFNLKEFEFSNIRVSYYVCGIIRKLFNKKSRQEGEPLNLFSIYAQNITLVFTKILDKIFTSKKDLAKLVFNKMIK